MVNIDDVIAGAHLPTTSISLCLRGDLQAEWEDLERQLREEQERDDGDSLAGNPAARELAERMEALAAEIRENQVTFLFQGLSNKRYSDLLVEHRLPEDKREDSPDGLDWATYPAALIAACAVDPAMTVEQAGRLSEAVTNRQWDDLFAAALSVNRSQVNVPKSYAASAILAATAPRSKQHANGVYPGPGSSAESLAG